MQSPSLEKSATGSFFFLRFSDSFTDMAFVRDHGGASGYVLEILKHICRCGHRRERDVFFLIRPPVDRLNNMVLSKCKNRSRKIWAQGSREGIGDCSHLGLICSAFVSVSLSCDRPVVRSYHLNDIWAIISFPSQHPS